MIHQCRCNWGKLVSAFVCTAFCLAADFDKMLATPVVFSNTNLITINGSYTPPTLATPYPSAILVSGLTNRVVRQATVTLQGFSHSFPSDVCVLLVGPQGQQCLLMANDGGQDKMSVTNLTFTFDDDASNFLPVLTALTNGTFIPTNGYLAQVGYTNLPFSFPAPAPVGNSNALSALSVFKNTNPNGVWNLFVVSSTPGDSGSIANGWSLNLTMAAPLVFSNTNLITINDSNNLPALATPYPSAILVSGLTNQVVHKATVTVQGFTHSFPSDVCVLLVGPQGQESLLMANSGGQDKLPVTNLTFTFDDAAPTSMPFLTALTNGTYSPTNGYLSLGNYTNLPFSFPAPAPVGNSNAPSVLSVFKNTDPDGVWNLFVLSADSGDSGSISNGWSLNLTMAAPMRIALSGSNIVVSWPASATNCALQCASGLTGTTWSNNASTVSTTNAGWISVTNPPPAGTMLFYRLVGN